MEDGGAVWKVCAVVGFLGVVVDARSEGLALVSGGVGGWKGSGGGVVERWGGVV